MAMDSNLLVFVTVAMWQLLRFANVRGRSRPGGVETVPASPAPVLPPPEFEADVESVAAEVAGRTPESIYAEGVTLVRPFLDDNLRIDPQRLARGLALLEHLIRLDPTRCAA